jgi:serine/threonine protein kinase
LTADPTIQMHERYVRSSLLGRGGMADVYQATDTVLDREVAVKMLRASAADEHERARFLTEARILAQLSHPRLVTILDVGVDSQQPFLVMELVDGKTLAELCSESPLTQAEVASVGAQVAEGLAHVHGSGVVHRDVKPGNILVADDGRAWVSDFGIAKLVGDTTQHTAEGLAVGTAAYLAPEQANGGGVGPAADVYSLGLVLMEAITGQRAYPGPPLEAAAARLTCPPEIPEWLSSDWQRLLRQMTASDAGNRPEAALVAARLRDIARERPVGAPPVFDGHPTVALADDEPRSTGVGWLVGWGVVVALVLMLAGGVFLARTGQEPPADTPEVPAASLTPAEPKPARHTDARPAKEQPVQTGAASPHSKGGKHGHSAKAGHGKKKGHKH